ncbi:MAG: metallophosphoesterase [Acidobacteriota bacterium]
MVLSLVSRRRFISTAGLVSLSPALPFESSLYRLRGKDQIEVTRHAVWIKNLPRAFGNLKVAQLSDIHHSKFISFNDVYRMVELTNRQRPDLVFLTGDYVTWSRKFIQPVAEALRNLKPRLGSFAVLGNHDFRVGPQDVTRALEGAGIRVLRNDSVRIDQYGESLWITGVDDSSSGQCDLEKALTPVPSRHPTILLAHNPEIIGQAVEREVDFIASGHTHGGQVKIPYLKPLHSVTQPGRDILEGFVRSGKTQMYISRGLGKVVVPLRILCPPELPVFRLVCYT